MMRRVLPDRVTYASVLSGLLLAFAFPEPDLSILAWFGLAPLFSVMEKRPFRSGFAAGLIFFLITLYWLNIVMVTYGQLHPFLSMIAWIALACYLALFWAGATWAACRIKAQCGYSLAMTLPVLWVALEYLREFFLTGFPWSNIGYSQQGFLSAIQSVDLFGVYGIVYLLVLCNVAISQALPALRRQQPFPLKTILCCVVLIIANFGYGQWRLGQEPDKRDQSVRVGLIQGNIEQGVKWSPEHRAETVNRYRSLSLQAAKEDGAQLLVWPESATPFYFQEGRQLSQQVSSLPSETGAYLLFGSPAYRQGSNSEYEYLNSAFLLSPKGQALGRSDKIHLVPFGEYVPLGEYLPFVNKLVAGIGDFSPGEISPLSMNGSQLGVLVCYESIFPELARDYVRQGSDLLVNITNDAWFGTSSAPWQHLAMARFRAIENRVWLVRAANTGISAFISPSGRVIKQTELFESTQITTEVGLGARPGLYSRIGDALPALFLLIGLGWLWQSRRSVALRA
ncbi:MAG: apolipoprotein N-acyltransferase [Desulfuromonadales bacterium]|nr:apolipoprotein N-acyltransferase [Desulfuromonadales bacterium]